MLCLELSSLCKTSSRIKNTCATRECQSSIKKEKLNNIKTFSKSTARDGKKTFSGLLNRLMMMLFHVTNKNAAVSDFNNIA